MKARIILTVSFLLVGMVLMAGPAMAGGWAVITLDQLPGKVVAGEAFEVGFVVRQHGITPLDGLEPKVYARQGELKLIGQAKARGEIGHYVATLTFPQEGEWTWSIQAFTGDQPMPPLYVLTESVAVQTQGPTPVPVNPSLVAGVLGLVGLATGLFVAFRRRIRWAIALLFAGLVLGAGSIVSAAEQPAAKSEARVLSADAPVSQVDVGRQLFIAKGCMVCHSHRETNKVREFGVDIGPDLTHIKADPYYLQTWLKDPKAVKATTQMPTLGLNEAEIEALIAFINAD